MTTILDLSGTGLETFAADYEPERMAGFNDGISHGTSRTRTKPANPTAAEDNPDAILSSEENEAIEAMFERWCGAVALDEGARR